MLDNFSRERETEFDEGPLQVHTPLALATAAGTPVMTFSAEVVEALRYILARLKRRGALPPALALVAALNGEGVTYVSRALGTVMANDLPATTCVVELNWWRPAAEIPAANGDKGIAAVSRGEVPLAEALVETNFPNLVLLPAGYVPRQERTALANSEGLATLLNDLSDRFDYLVLDIPAVLATSDAIPLVSLADACCLVVDYGAASVEKIGQALEDIDHVAVLGTIMNEVELATPQWLLNFMPRE